jgi:hypothetical protein
LKQTFEFRLKKIKGNEKNINNIKLNPIGWEIACCILEVVTNKTKDMVEATRFISLSCDEVSTLQSIALVSIHAYMVEDWW